MAGKDMLTRGDIRNLTHTKINRAAYLSHGQIYDAMPNENTTYIVSWVVHRGYPPNGLGTHLQFSKLWQSSVTETARVSTVNHATAMSRLLHNK